MRRVAGWSHMRGCIAGATSTGPRAPSASAVTRSSARPCARRESTSAVAGTMATRSACSAIVTCISPANEGSHMSVATASPQMPASVTGPTKRDAEAVITGSDARPGLHEQARELHGLVRRDAPGDAERDCAAGHCPCRRLPLPLGSAVSALARACGLVVLGRLPLLAHRRPFAHLARIFSRVRHEFASPRARASPCER